jgi:hypothetical protein
VLDEPHHVDHPARVVPVPAGRPLRLRSRAARGTAASEDSPLRASRPRRSRCLQHRRVPGYRVKNTIRGGPGLGPRETRPARALDGSPTGAPLLPQLQGIEPARGEDRGRQTMADPPSRPSWISVRAVSATWTFITEAGETSSSKGADERPTANASSTAGNVHLRKGPRAKTHLSFLTAVDGRDTNGQRVTRPKH